MSAIARRRAVLLAAIALVVSCGGRDPAPVVATPPAHPNLVLFLIDTLRADRLGAYGYPRPVSPHLDAFAADAILFEHAVAQSSWTRPAMVSVFTGLLAQRHRVNGRLDRVPDRYTMLAEVLAAAGYQNAAFVSNANMAARFGVAQGFESYRMMRRAGSRGEPTVAAAMEWLDARADPAPPFFLYLHLVEPHAPYRPPEDLRRRFAGAAAPMEEPPGRAFMKRLGSGEVAVTAELVDWLRDLYDGEVAAADGAFAALREGLRERRLYDDSILLVLSDHGEELHEHAGWEHGKTLYGEVIDVPVLLRLPGGPRGLRVKTPVAQVDLLPTLLDAMTIEAPAGLDGRALQPFFARPSRRVAAVEGTPLHALLDLEGRRIEAVTVGGWRLIRRRTADGERSELYHLDADPGETRDLAAAEPERVARLTAHLDAAARTGEGAAAPEAAEIDPELAQQLRALGYL